MYKIFYGLCGRECKKSRIKVWYKGSNECELCLCAQVWKEDSYQNIVK